MKLLVMVDSPALPTGFSRVGQNLLRRWAGNFERIDIWAIGHAGVPGKPGEVWDKWWNQPPFVMYAPAGAGRWNSADNLSQFLSLIVEGDYTHVWILQDHFQLAAHDFARQLRIATTPGVHPQGPKKQVRVLYYCPVDAAVESGWANVLNQVDCAVAYTEWGRAELTRQIGVLNRTFPPVHPDGRYGPLVRVIPHGVDTEVFKVLPEEDRSALREQVLGGWVQPGDVVLLNVNANQRRKDVARSLEILAALKEMDPGTRYRLVMHMRVQDEGQINLETVGRQLGLVRGEDWNHTGHLFRGPYGDLSEAELNGLYNTADLYLTTTLGEGWGFGITEALAAGCVAAVPDHTACAEIAARVEAEGLGEKIVRLPLEKHRVWLMADNCRGRQRVDVDAAARWIQIAAGNLRLRRERGEPRTGLNRPLRKWLDWDRIAEAWLDLFQPETGLETAVEPAEGVAPEGVSAPATQVALQVSKRPHHFYLEWGGGLGDVFNHMHTGQYAALSRLPEDKTATVALVCANPFAREVLAWHPRVVSGQVQVLQLPYWTPEQDETQRLAHGLPRRGAYEPLPPVADAGPVEWFISEEDRRVLHEFWGSILTGNQYVVLSLGAGLPDRSIPAAMANEIVRVLRQARPDLTIVNTGRTFDRHGRSEVPVEDANVVNLVDRLSVPGTAVLLRSAAGLVTCHSALNILGWHLQIPQLLLYPEATRQKHFLKKDQWSFGADDGRTVHGTFGQCAAAWYTMTREFMGKL